MSKQSKDIKESGGDSMNNKYYGYSASYFIDDFERRHPQSYFFRRNTLKFFGERISDMRILQKTATIADYDGAHECYVLSSLQRKYPGGPRRKYHYFDVDTLEHIIPKREAI